MATDSTPQPAPPVTIDIAAADVAKSAGNALFSAGKFSEAVQKYNEATSLNPRDFATYSNRSISLFKLGQYKESARDALISVRINKNWAKGYYRLGLAMAAMGNPVRALDAFQVGLVAAPDNTELRAAAIQARAAIKNMRAITWQAVPALGRTGEPPPQRCAHSATHVGTKLFCFGGFANGVMMV